MGRYRGTFTVAANYEPLKAAPFDARQLVGTKDDLVTPSTWQQINGDAWTYVGMPVVVSADPNPSNNGQYILTASDYTNIANWDKQATTKQIDDLQAQINDLKLPESTALEEYKTVNDARVGQIELDLAAQLARILVLEAAKEDYEVRFSNYDEQIEALIAEGTKLREDIEKKANSADVYTKEETHSVIDDAIKALVAPDLSDYLKTEDAAKTYATIAALDSVSKRLEVVETKSEYVLPAATASALGGVKLSEEVGVNEEGQLKIQKVSTDTLENGVEELILCGGTSNE